MLLPSISISSSKFNQGISEGEFYFSSHRRALEEFSHGSGVHEPNTEAAPGLRARAQPPAVFRGGSSGAKSPAESRLVAGELAGPGVTAVGTTRRGQNRAESRRDTAEKGLSAAGQAGAFVSCSNNSNCCKPEIKVFGEKPALEKEKGFVSLAKGFQLSVGILG